ncbi:MAG TPA: DMT family transporter [Nitrospirota bacterium]|nr:DMT family transporter [Nitrospirota bacterium]
MGGNISGLLAMAATAFLWSLAGLLIKLIDWNPVAIAGARSLIASAVIAWYLRRPIFHFSFPQIAAAVANAATMLLFVSANKTTTAANAILLQYLAPVLTAVVAAPVLRERTRAEHSVAIALVLIGMIVMFSDELGGGRSFGNALAVISAVTFSFFFIFMRMQKDGSPLESLLLSHWITAGICLFVSLFLPAPHVTARSLIAVALLGAVQMGLSAVLFSYAIRRVSAVSANIVAIIEPVFNPLWVFLATGEAPGVRTLLGGSLIILAVTAASVISAGRRSGSEPAL